MADDWPKIVKKRVTRISPWVSLIERAVAFAPGAEPQLYHAVSQQDYITIVALTPDGRIPIVRQYRPAVERHTWELPAALVDEGESPQACCERELKEETGFSVRTITAMGVYAPCTSRLSNAMHSFFVTTVERVPASPPEPGIELKLVSPAELGELVLSGEFELMLHIGVLLLAGLRGRIDLGC
jgi:ADP-ribose pyrophosphatase